MQKLVVALFISFMIFGMVLHAPLLIADEDNDNSGPSDDSVTDNSDSDDDSANDNSGSSDDVDDNDSEDDANQDDEEETGEESEDDDSRFRERARAEIRAKNGCVIKIEREIKFENGKRVEEIKRKMECADGRKREVQIKVESRTSDGKVRERIKYEFEGEELEVEAEEGIDLEEESNATHYRLRARLRNGNATDIKIMPDTASEIALERLRALNFTIELREVRHKNIPRVVYNIETNKHGRFLGVFKLAMKVEGEVDPETGEFLGVSKPWWAFLVAGEDSDQTQPGEDEEEEEDTGEEENETNQITVNLLEQNNSSETGTATLVESNGQVTVTIDMTGFQEDVSQPAHIHAGSCPDVGAVSYPLTDVLNGESETILNVTFDVLEDELPLALNVHKSAEEAAVYTACGNLGF